MVINTTCRWCHKPIRSRNKTGMCRECFSEYVDRCAEITHTLEEGEHRKPANPRDFCECGNSKDKRAKQCMECWSVKRDKMIREVGRKYYPRKFTLAYLPPSKGGNVNWHSGWTNHGQSQ